MGGSLAPFLSAFMCPLMTKSANKLTYLPSLSISYLEEGFGGSYPEELYVFRFKKFAKIINIDEDHWGIRPLDGEK